MPTSAPAIFKPLTVKFDRRLAPSGRTSVVAPDVPVTSIPADQPGLNVPQAGKATDVASAITAVNQLSEVVALLSNQMPPPNNQAGTGAEGLRNYTPRLRHRRARTRSDESEEMWQEVERTIQHVRIHNPEDENQWVEVERITKTKLVNKLTGEMLIWRYKRL